MESHEIILAQKLDEEEVESKEVSLKRSKLEKTDADVNSERVLVLTKPKPDQEWTEKSVRWVMRRCPVEDESLWWVPDERLVPRERHAERDVLVKQFAALEKKAGTLRKELEEIAQKNYDSTLRKYTIKAFGGWRIRNLKHFAKDDERVGQLEQMEAEISKEHNRRDLVKLDMRWCKQRFIVQMAPFSLRENAFWTLLLCLCRLRIKISPEIRRLLFRFYRYFSLPHPDWFPAAHRLAHGLTWLPGPYEKDSLGQLCYENEHVLCVDAKCREFSRVYGADVCVAASVMDVFSVAAYWTWLGKHFTDTHGLPLSRYSQQAPTCQHAIQKRKAIVLGDPFNLGPDVTICKECGKFLSIDPNWDKWDDYAGPF